MSSIQPRCGRYHPVLREMLAENHLALSDFMVPLFIKPRADMVASRGEYAMLQAAIKRAGARIIISYFAEEMPQLFKRSCL